MAENIDVLIRVRESGMQAFTRASSQVGGLRGSIQSVTPALSGMGTAISALGAVASGVLIGQVVHSVITAGIAYQDQMNTLQVVSGATAAQMAQLGQRAKDLGNDLSLPNTSAADAANAMVELAKAGLSVDQTMKAAKGTLQLAAAANIDEASAATITAQALNAFHLSGDQAVRVADLLAASANASAADISDMALALQQSAASAAQLQVPIDDLTTMIAEMANAGIKGSDAGTSIKTMLAALTPNSDAAAAAMRMLGVSVFDAGGQMRPMRELVNQFSTSLAKLTPQQRAQAIETIFGSDASRAASIILGQNVKAYDDLHKAVTKAGAAQEVAAAKSRGLGGTLRAIQSQVETFSLAQFERLAPTLESIAGRVSKLFSGAINPAQLFFGVMRDLGVPVATAAIVSNRLGDAISYLQAHLPDIVDAAGKVATKIADIVPPAAELAAKVADDLVPALKTLIPSPLLDIAGALADRIGPGLKLAADHSNILVPALIALGGAMVVVKVAQAGIAAAEFIGALREAVVVAGILRASIAALGVELIVTKGGMIAAAIAQGIVTVATAAWTAMQWLLNVALTANTIGLIVVGIGILIGVIVLLVTHWSTVVQWLQTGWAWIVKVAGAISNWIDHNRGLAVALGILGGPITIIIGLVALLITHWDQVKDAAGRALDGLKNFVSWAWSNLKPIFDKIGEWAHAAGDALGALNPFRRESPSLVDNVFAGARVIEGRYGAMASNVSSSLWAVRPAMAPAAAPVGTGTAQALSGGQQPITNNFYGIVDHQALARTVSAELAWRAKTA